MPDHLGAFTLRQRAHPPSALSRPVSALTPPLGELTSFLPEIRRRFNVSYKSVPLETNHPLRLTAPEGMLCLSREQELKENKLGCSLKKEEVEINCLDWMAEYQANYAKSDGNQIRRARTAFISCLYCGLRLCDVKVITYANVDYSNKLLKFEQSKTKAHSASSGVIIPLNDGLLALIGQPKDGNRNQLIFPLPSHTMCLNALRHWVARAGIEKHITWHCARHSCGTNLLSNGAIIKTVASILGHNGLAHTEKYIRAVDSLKQAAIDSMPPLIID